MIETHAYNLTPKTRTVTAKTLRRGDVILESHEHPARVVKVSVVKGSVYIHCQYIWQPRSERTWPLGPLHPDASIEKAV